MREGARVYIRPALEHDEQVLFWRKEAMPAKEGAQAARRDVTALPVSIMVIT